MKQIIAILLATAFIMLVGCTKDEFVERDGLVRYTGSLPDGGCGYILQFPSISFEAQNLPSEFEQDSLPVTVRYKRLSDAPICTSSTVEGIIYIHKITGRE